MSRSIVAALHGDIAASLYYHNLGLLVLGYILLQFVFRLGIILFPNKRSGLVKYGKYLNLGLIVILALLGINWVYVLASILN